MTQHLPGLGGLEAHILANQQRAVSRSARREVRNPILALPAAQRIMRLPHRQRADLAELLMDLSGDARERAEKAWSTRKPPMAAYWAATAVVAKHIARVLRHAE